MAISKLNSQREKKVGMQALHLHQKIQELIALGFLLILTPTYSPLSSIESELP
jgi:hypothetical protein